MKFLPDDVDRFGKFINLTFKLFLASLSTNALHCVVLPARSQPSRTINAPLTNCIFEFLLNLNVYFDIFTTTNITSKLNDMTILYFGGKGQSINERNLNCLR